MPAVPSSAWKYSAPLKAVNPEGLESVPPRLMSFTSTGPVTVPSVFQSSTPEVPSSAAKYSAPLKTVNPEGLESVGLMSFTSIVPLAVPSVVQSSTPEVPSLAAKYSAPLNTVKPSGKEVASPGLMSFTSTVPAVVPSLFHSSRPETPSSARKYSAPLAPSLAPWKTVNPLLGKEGTAQLFTSCVPLLVPSVFQSSTPSLAEKYSAPLAPSFVPLKTVNPTGAELPAPVLMSFTSTVPASVPLVFQSSMPVAAPPSARKYSAPLAPSLIPLKTVKPKGEELPAPVLMSFTRTVPASVPLVFQSSAPELPSLARKYSAPLKTVNPRGVEPAPGLMFFTHTVPASVPLVFQSSTPEAPSLAAKNRPGPTAPAQPSPPLLAPPPLAPPQPTIVRVKSPSAASASPRAACRPTRRMESTASFPPVSISILPLHIRFMGSSNGLLKHAAQEPVDIDYRAISAPVGPRAPDCRDFDIRACLFDPKLTRE